MNRLEGLHRADAAIVGGGLTGLLVGSALAQAGMQVAVVDASEGRKDAPACAVSMLGCASALARAASAHGLDAIRPYAAGLQAQLHDLLDASLPYVRPSAEYAYAHAGELSTLEARHGLLQALQIPVSIAEDAGGCPFPVALSMTARAGLIDLNRWQEALETALCRRGGQIFRASRVISLRSGRVITSQGCLEAPQIILTTGKPLGLRARPLLALLESRRLAQCTLTGMDPLHSCQRSVRREGLAFHPVAEGIAVQWDAGRIGMPKQQAQLLSFEATLRRFFPEGTPRSPRYARAVSPLDGLPVIGPLADPQAQCIAGTDGCGVLGAMHAAEVMTRRLLGHARREDSLYLPDRRLPRSIRRRAMGRCRQACLTSMLRRKAPVCAHCGCALRYSTAVRCWECPYCGTCYSMLGQVLCAPGTQNAHLSVLQRPDL